MAEQRSRTCPPFYLFVGDIVTPPAPPPPRTPPSAKASGSARHPPTRPRDETRWPLADFRLHLFQRIPERHTAGQIGDVGGEIFLAFFDHDSVARRVNPSARPAA